MTRKGRKIKVGEDFRIAVHLSIKKFRLTEDQKEFEFPSSLNSTERAYLHKFCHNLGLNTKSRGKGANRFLTVYKKEGSTIVQADAVFELGIASQQHTLNLLQRHPVLARERQELLPPTERDRILGQDAIRDINRSMGRLSSGIPMVPPRRCENEYTAYRQTLPIWASREEIIQLISCHQTVIISGETGSGKTTQVPQFILDHCSMILQPCRIICTEPRRIAALAVAERVAVERDEKVGQTIGYQIRLESRMSPKTLLTFCTTGVLLRTLMGGDASIATVTHILVDELHERDRLSDFLLIVLRDLLLKFRNLKLILMSASLDTQLFCKYFSNCPVIEVPGRVYEVKTFFLEDILKGTGFTNPNMLKYKKILEKQKSAPKLKSWCSLPSAQSKGNTSDENCEVQNFPEDIKFDDLTLNTNEIKPEVTDLDAHLTETMDKIIEDIWVSGSNDFSYLLQFILMENISVDYQHSETNVSALMLAAGRSNVDVAEQLLALGASLHLKSSNGWTALDWAIQFGNKEVEELLAGQCSSSAIEKELAIDQLDISEEDKILLDAYNHSIDEDKIDFDLIICLLQRICASQDEGSVLVFLSGYDDIMSLKDKILNSSSNIPESRITLFTLHSQMQNSDQKRIFRPVPPGIRKIILATNIAETSITINDVVFVVDCGKVKEKSYDALSGVSHLKAGWISKASAVQRRGRAGRCRPGLCYHLFSKARFNSFQKFQVPEILRVPIHELCLQAKLLAPPNAPIADFLAKAPDPPPFMVTRNAVTLLKTIDALDSWEELTELGLHLLDLPIEPRLGKMLLYSVLLKCLDPVLTIVCCLAYRDPFVLPKQPCEKREVANIKRKFAAETYSDHIVLLRAFQAWQKAKADGNEHSFCKRNYLSAPNLEMIMGMRSNLLGQLRASGFVRVRGSGDLRDLNANSETWAVVKAAICAGTYPNLIRVDRDRQQLITQKESKVRFHNSSVLNKVPLSCKQKPNDVRKKSIADLRSDWLIYEEMMRTGMTAHAHCCTLISPITVALFAGPARLPLDALHEPDQAHLEGYIEEEDSEDDTRYDNQKAMFKIDDWISFRVETEMAHLVLQLRLKWHALFLKRMHAPSKPLSPADESVIQAVVGVLLSEDLALNLPQPLGIGQRPKTVDYYSPKHLVRQQTNSPKHLIRQQTNSPKHLVRQQANSPNHKGYNYFSMNNSFNCNDHSTCSGACNCNTNFGKCSPLPNMLQSFDVPQQQLLSPVSSSRIAYFIIKANTSRVVEVSIMKNVWAFAPSTERKLLSAIKEGKEVILIFSIQGSGHFQGYARFTPHLSDQRLQEFSAANLSSCYQIEWLKKGNIPFQNTRHLQNAWNENRKVQISRDGQELEPSVGESLCKVIAQSVYSMDSAKSNRRRTSYGRENYSSDSSPINRGQMQWEAQNKWFDPSSQNCWPPSNM